MPDDQNTSTRSQVEILAEARKYPEGQYVYMSGPLSFLPQPDIYKWVTKEIYEYIAAICEKIDIPCYLPHLSDTAASLGRPARSVYVTDRDRVKESGAVVAYIPPEYPSYGVGMEIEMARQAKVPVIALYKRDDAVRVNRFLLGCPSIVDSILFDKPSEIEKRLLQLLYEIFSRRSLEQVRDDRDLRPSEYQPLVESLDKIVAASSRRGIEKPITYDQWIATLDNKS